jgi:hypothetical protein
MQGKLFCLFKGLVLGCIEFSTVEDYDVVDFGGRTSTDHAILSVYLDQFVLLIEYTAL